MPSCQKLSSAAVGLQPLVGKIEPSAAESGIAHAQIPYLLPGDPVCPEQRPFRYAAAVDDQRPA